MSLATRCPTCGTVFRVVHDQLLVSEGWVRCGRCAGVFNAADDLLDIATGRPVQLSAGAAAPARRAAPDPAAATPDLADRWDAPVAPADAEPAHLQAPSSALPSALPSANTEPPAEPPARPADAPGWPAPATAPPAFTTPQAMDPAGDAPPSMAPPAPAAASALAEADSAGLLLRAPSQEPEPATGDAGAAPQGDSALTEAHGGLSATLADPAHAAAPALAALAAFPQEAAPPAEAAPEFVRAADRAAHWRRTPVRAGALAAALGLGALALAQGALLWRDPLAARHPGWAGPLQALCRVAGCQVQPLHRIEQLSVDASGLSRVETAAAASAPAPATEAPDAAASAAPAAQPAMAQYRLNLTLRNRADTPLAAPAVELSLTDLSGQLVLRKVLRLADLGSAQTVLAAGQELPLQALLNVGERRIDGYTVELFYP